MAKFGSRGDSADGVRYERLASGYGCFGFGFGAFLEPVHPGVGLAFSVLVEVAELASEDVADLAKGEKSVEVSTVAFISLDCHKISFWLV